MQPELLRRLMLMRRRYVVGAGIASRLGLFGWEERTDKIASWQQGVMQQELEKYLQQVDPGWVEQVKPLAGAGAGAATEAAAKSR